MLASWLGQCCRLTVRLQSDRPGHEEHQYGQKKKQLKATCCISSGLLLARCRIMSMSCKAAVASPNLYIVWQVLANHNLSATSFRFWLWTLCSPRRLSSTMRSIFLARGSTGPTASPPTAHQTQQQKASHGLPQPRSPTAQLRSKCFCNQRACLTLSFISSSTACACSNGKDAVEAKGEYGTLFHLV